MDMIVINPKDNVAVVIRPIKSGERVAGLSQEIFAQQDVPRNHKIALKEIRTGERIIKYGETIGIATRDIHPGEWVHTHNLKAEEN